jgi:hypothetical protein
MMGVSKMNTEDKFTFNGNDYVAVPTRRTDDCTGCAFLRDWVACMSDKHPTCNPSKRRDGSDVIFVLNHKKKTEYKSMTTMYAYQMVQTNQMTPEQFIEWVDAVGARYFSAGQADMQEQYNLAMSEHRRTMQLLEESEARVKELEEVRDSLTGWGSR